MLEIKSKGATAEYLNSLRCTQLAEYQLQKGNYTNAIELLKEAHKLVNVKSQRKHASRIFLLMGKCLLQTAKPKSALKYLEMSASLNASVQCDKLLVEATNKSIFSNENLKDSKLNFPKLDLDVQNQPAEAKLKNLGRTEKEIDPVVSNHSNSLPPMFFSSSRVKIPSLDHKFMFQQNKVGKQSELLNAQDTLSLSSTMPVISGVCSCSKYENKRHVSTVPILNFNVENCSLTDLTSQSKSVDFNVKCFQCQKGLDYIQNTHRGSLKPRIPVLNMSMPNVLVQSALTDSIERNKLYQNLVPITIPESETLISDLLKSPKFYSNDDSNESFLKSLTKILDPNEKLSSRLLIETEIGSPRKLRGENILEFSTYKKLSLSNCDSQIFQANDTTVDPIEESLDTVRSNNVFIPEDERFGTPFASNQKRHF